MQLENSNELLQLFERLLAMSTPCTNQNLEDTMSIFHLHVLGQTEFLVLLMIKFFSRPNRFSCYISIFSYERPCCPVSP